jgi:cysteine-rich repeat protein
MRVARIFFLFALLGRTLAKCGDGVADATEACEDGNVRAGDGCDNACQCEPGYICGPAPGINASALRLDCAIPWSAAASCALTASGADAAGAAKTALVTVISAFSMFLAVLEMLLIAAQEGGHPKVSFSRPVFVLMFLFTMHCALALLPSARSGEYPVGITIAANLMGDLVWEFLFALFAFRAYDRMRELSTRLNSRGRAPPQEAAKINWLSWVCFVVPLICSAVENVSEGVALMNWRVGSKPGVVDLLPSVAKLLFYAIIAARTLAALVLLGRAAISRADRRRMPRASVLRSTWKMRRREPLLITFALLVIIGNLLVSLSELIQQALVTETPAYQPQSYSSRVAVLGALALLCTQLCHRAQSLLVALGHSCCSARKARQLASGGTGGDGQSVELDRWRVSLSSFRSMVSVVAFALGTSLGFAAITNQLLRDGSHAVAAPGEIRAGGLLVTTAAANATAASILLDTPARVQVLTRDALIAMFVSSFSAIFVLTLPGTLGCLSAVPGKRRVSYPQGLLLLPFSAYCSPRSYE